MKSERHARATQKPKVYYEAAKEELETKPVKRRKVPRNLEEMKTIEVEIRGTLDDAEYARAKSFLDKHSVHRESHEREMFLLRDYPGYSKDFVGREVDIRLRNTNGSCEIMLKQKIGNAREEVSLQLKESNLETAKKIVKALGCTSAIWMHRLKEVYEYRGMEWSLVVAPNNIRYYEAELVVDSEGAVPV